MIRSLYYVPGIPIRKNILPQEFPELIQNQQGLLWVDFINEPPETCRPILQDFHFHQLAINDALQETHIPKLDDWGDYLYIVLNYMNAEENGEAIAPLNEGWESLEPESDRSSTLGKEIPVLSSKR